jgi:hypothetical protein
MERSEALRVLHDIAARIPSGSADERPPAQARSARTSTATASATVTDAKQFLAGFVDQQERDSGRVSERRDRSGVRLRRSEDRKAFAAAGMNDEFDQQQVYQNWVRNWTEGTTSAPSVSADDIP